MKKHIIAVIHALLLGVLIGVGMTAVSYVWPKKIVHVIVVKDLKGWM